MSSTRESVSTYTSDTEWLKKEKLRMKCVTEYDLEEIQTAENNLNSLVSVASYICNTPLSFITIVGETHCEFIARLGLDLCRIDKKESICTLAIEHKGNFEVTDTHLHPVIKNMAVATKENPFRYYAGVPLVSPKGYAVGEICVLDYIPRKIDENQWKTLKVLGDHVMIYLESLRQNKMLKDALQREEVSKAKDNFLANMSHEIRTPLNAINAYADLLNRTDLNSVQKEACTAIKTSSELLISIVSDVLDFSKIESGNFVLENCPFDLKETIYKTKEILFKSAEKKELSLNFDIDEKIPVSLIGDNIRITQILLNLLGNAIKFTENGLVNFIVKVIETTEKAVTLFFSVEDTGIGIPENKLDRIFERFEQINAKNGGTGLGLSITKNLVEIHNGKLNVESKLGVGSKFYFIITYEKVNDNLDNFDENILNDKSKNLEKKYNVKNGENLNNLSNILICEDNAINIKLITHLFKNNETLTTIAENGKIAVEILQEKKDFDLIIMDINMPIMDGIEATKIIRNTLNLSIPIIGFTANTCPSERELCLKIGMDEYIMKTFVQEEFFKKINQVLKTTLIKVSNRDSCDNIRQNSSNNLKFLNESINDNEYNTKILITDLSDKTLNNLTIEPFDTQYIKEFSNDDPDFQIELIELFLEETPKHMEELKNSIYNDDKESVRFFIHKMKSPLTMIGLDCINIKFQSIRDILHTTENRVLIQMFIQINKQMEYYYNQINIYLNETLKI